MLPVVFTLLVLSAVFPPFAHLVGNEHEVQGSKTNQLVNVLDMSFLSPCEPDHAIAFSMLVCLVCGHLALVCIMCLLSHNGSAIALVPEVSKNQSQQKKQFSKLQNTPSMIFEMEPPSKGVKTKHQP
eukprot:3111351-Amphidinium_carterae.1